MESGSVNGGSEGTCETRIHHSDDSVCAGSGVVARDLEELMNGKLVEAKQESLIPMNGELHAELVPAQSETTSILRLAIEKGASIETIERLMGMMKEERAYRVETEFNEALSQAQTEMQCVAPDKTNAQTSSDFASYAALDKMVRPIYTKHGFSLSFDEEDSPRADHVRVIALLSRGGHTRRYRKDICADGKGAKGGDVMTRTHAEGAADSYGMRYLTKKIFNIAVGEEDDDGNISMGNVADWLTLIKEAKTIAELKEQYGKAVADALLPDKAPKASGKAIEFYKEARKKREAELRAKSETGGPL